MAEHTVSRRQFAAGLSGGVALAAAAGALPAQAAPRGGSDPLPTGLGIGKMTLEQKVGQLFVQQVYGSDATTADERNLPLYGVASPAEVIAKYHLGGVIYFTWTDSVQNPQQIVGLSNGLQRAAVGSGAGIPLVISVDQEQGIVTRIGPPATQFPGSMALGAGRSVADARVAAAITGQELLAMGIRIDHAPDSDVNVNPLNPVIGTRSFSSRPDLVSEMVTAQVRGYQHDARISATCKHFPGHGDTATDSHFGLPVITHTREEWERIDAPPFRAAIKAGTDLIMSAHLLVPALDDSGDPATLSKPILTGILRGELGYQGVIMTDALNMQGVREKYGDAEVAVRAVLAGADMLLMSPAMDDAYGAVLDAVRSGRIPRNRLDESVRRILQLKARKGILAHPYVDPARVDDVVGTPEHLATADAVSNRTTTLVKNDEQVLPMQASGASLLVTGYGVTTTQTIADGLGAKGASVQRIVTGTRPSDAEAKAAVAAAEGKDAVVVTTMNARGYEEQQALVAALVGTGTPVIVVAVRDPYDIAYLTEAKTYLATYSYSPVALEAAVRVIAGEVSPTATLPVDIPTASDPQKVLYPFGFGLTY
ncbi:MAG TPA: glycoside hydrolase family 3 protein [Segeticoccus sp.]|uniref:glycoside hydrolase family 3 protein n=1 Tax=Segeticoccus sp. TaxID=2706531 RepID=UPI002D7EEF53|nr:glycoside hydrolase family 3 protein [Segeticoccus sp.]HET8598769.1 glycoside hydrolase family 3 protein [Segeticoccus sp.]